MSTHRVPQYSRIRGLAVILAAVLACLVGCERAKDRLDREVDRLCSIDGGVKIYEIVPLSKENFGPFGEVFPQYSKDVASGGALGPLYVWTLKREVIISGNPSLTRSENSIVRRSDGKLLGRHINYERGGGDMPGPWAPSSHSCSDRAVALAQLVFVREKNHDD
jgi:hypothetical protein